jgi:hypothetical protein
MRLTLWVLGWQTDLEAGLTRCLTARRRGDRGLAQSTETALLVAGAVLVASIIFVAVKALIQTKLSEATSGAQGIS